MAAKKDSRIGQDPLAWIQDTREGKEESNTVITSEDKKVVESEGEKVGKSESERAQKSESVKVAKSESEKKDKKSFSIAKGILEELKLLAWYMDRSDSQVVEEAIKMYLANNKDQLLRARKVKQSK